MALLHYFYTHAQEYGIILSAANCEHGIRGQDSLSDSLFVKELCQKWNIPLFSFSADCVLLAKEKKVSLETAARNFRYECFDGLLADGRVDFVATAHHQNDNAETVLFHICRGAALTGASGIAETNRRGYIRPLLHAAKQEICNYLKENGLSYRLDKTNEDDSITRNGIRLKALPLLEKITPGATANIARFAALAKADDELLYELAQPLLLPLDGGVKVLFCDKKPLFQRACLLALKAMGIEKDYTLAHLDALFDLQAKNNGDKAPMPEKITGIREYDGVVLYRSKTKPTEEIPFATGTFCLGQTRWSVEQSAVRERDGCLYLDGDKIPASAVFRTRRTGDMFQKFGGGTKKLKDYLIDKKIPLRERENCVVLADGRQILAIVGIEISQKVKVDKDSKIIKIKIQKQGE